MWPRDQRDLPNHYVQFVQDLQLDAELTSSAEIAISADTNYAVWLNGEFIGTGQWSNYPDDKTFDVLKLSSARAGENRLCVLGWYQGENSSQYRKGEAGLVFAVRAAGRLVGQSGEATRMRRAPDYVSGSVPRVTPQLSFTFEYHAKLDDGWRRAGYAVSDAWRTPGADEMKSLTGRPVRPRPVARLTLEDRLPMRVHAQGVFLRGDTHSSAAIAMQSDALSARLARNVFVEPHVSLTGADSKLEFKADTWKHFTGPYLVLDTGREEAGLLDLDIEAPRGTMVDVAYGEHLEDLRVRATVGGRNFANRIVCGDGITALLHPFLRIAGRYIELHITPAPEVSTKSIVLNYAGMRPTNYPAAEAGSFKCGDTLHNQIWQVSKRTLQLCMHEHYEDCPWREQSLYAMDSRNQALAGYYCFGNYDFAAASIDLLGRGQGADGFLELCAPARVPITIPSFSLAWILMLDDHLVYAGDREFTRSQLPVARGILEACGGHTSGSLIQTPGGPRMWNYYEWAPGLDGSGKSGFDVLKAERLDAPLNLFYLLALDAMGHMNRECGVAGDEFTSRAAKVRREFAGVFWDAQEHAVRSYAGAAQQPHFAELTQSLAILAGVVPADELDGLRARLARDNNGLVPCTLSSTLYKFDALLTDADKYGNRVFECIARDWGYMLHQGATSFWETIDGAAAFDNAGSLCHGWSGIPAYFYGRYILGVRPTKPGFTQYEARPRLNILPSAKGVVSSPHDPIIVP